MVAFITYNLKVYFTIDAALTTGFCFCRFGRTAYSDG